VSAHSIQFQVLRAVVDQLGGKAQNAHRCRLRDFSAEELGELGADNVLPEKESNDEQTTDDSELIMRFQVVHMVQATEGADRHADLRYVRAFELLMANQTLGGLVRRVKYISRDWHIERRELELMSIVVTYECEFSTSRTDPKVAGY
jgi:hypothetical protein